ncbi:MAG: DUF4332 domain-containing protein [Acidimicrobiia bacterium]|nr:DUF4332 domain-containing protein [Acidimicrobiia bacterium]
MASYSIDLASISLDEFRETLLTIELLPSRRALADHIAAIVPKLVARGTRDLAGLRKLLARKVDYPALAVELGVDVDYLKLLNREVNSYVSKPIPLAKLESLSDEELAALEAAGLKSTKDLYERCALRSDRAAVASATAIKPERLERALGLANLIRVNGVGPAFAEYLFDAGVTGPADFLDRDLQQMVDDYAAQIPDGPRLRIEDLEFVQRYCRGLSEEIEW